MDAAEGRAIIIRLIQQAMTIAPNRVGFSMFCLQGEVNVQQCLVGYEIYWREFSTANKGRYEVKDGDPLFGPIRQLDERVRPKYEQQMQWFEEFKRALR